MGPKLLCSFFPVFAAQRQISDDLVDGLPIVELDARSARSGLLGFLGVQSGLHQGGADSNIAMCCRASLRSREGGGSSSKTHGVRQQSLGAARGALSLAALVPVGNTLLRHWRKNRSLVRR